MNKAQRIRAIFEGNVIAMYSPDDERYKAAEKANRRRVSMQAQARAEQARGSHVTAGQKTIDTLGKNLSPEMLRKVMQKDIKAHHERRRKSMNSSTNYYIAGLKSLFEAVLLEKRGQSPLSKVFGDKMRKHVAKQRQRGKESIESSKKLVAKGVYSPEHTEDTAEIVRQGEKDLIKSARSGGRQILGKPPQHDSTDHYRAGLRALFESVIEEADIYQKSVRTPSHINPVKASSVLIKKMSKSSKPGMSKQDADKAARAGIAKSNYHKALKGMAARKAADPYDYDYDMYYEAQDPKKLQRLQNKRLKPMTAWDATINVLPKAKTRSQRKVDRKAAELRAKETDYPDPQDP